MPQPEPRRQKTASRGRQRGKCEKSRYALKVKIPIFHTNSLSTKWATKDKTPRRWTLERMTRTYVNGGGADTDADAVGGDVPSSKAATEKEKAKLAVLRTISRMLEENQLIRQRLFALTQAN